MVEDGDAGFLPGDELAVEVNFHEQMEDGFGWVDEESDCLFLRGKTSRSRRVT
jgi:hypothetical protein